MTRTNLHFGLVLLLAGCGRAQKNEDFVPAESTARSALEAYLKAWARGGTAQIIPDTKPAVMVSDGQRGTRSLIGYEILGQVLLSTINIAYYQQLMAGMREAIAAGSFADFHAATLARWTQGDIAPV